MSLVAFPRQEHIPLDANGLPCGHHAALHKVSADFCDWCNELPESVYFLRREDAQELADRLIAKYLHNVVRER